MKRLLFLPILFMLCWSAEAAPVVNSYDNVTGVVTCTGAGSKSTAAPIKFDNMETGEVNQALTMSGWNNSNDGAIYNADQAYSGSLAAYNYVETNAGGDSIGRGGFDSSYIYFTETDVVYLSFYFRISTPFGSGAGQQKNCRIGSTGSTDGLKIYDGPGTMKMNVLNPSYIYSYDLNEYDPGDGSVFIADIGCAADQWHKFEYWYKLSTAGVADGECTIIQLDGDSSINKDIITRNEGETFQLHSVLLGVEMANIGYRLTNPTKVEMWIDDVFIDNTFQRVVIGDNATFASCTKRDDQSATVWSDTSITLGTLNTPSFVTGETMYLFLVDSDGVASAGLEIDPAPLEITGQMASNGGTIQFN